MLTVADLMSTHLITAGWDDVIGPIRDKMLDSGVHLVPVLDDAGEPIGVVSSWDHDAGDMVGVVSSFDILSFVADDLEASR